MDIKEIINNKIFWIASLAFAIVIFLSAINSNKVYQSEMDVLFLPKSETAVQNIEKIIANAEQIPLTLSFYNKLIENNPAIVDGSKELPNYKRKDFWNSIVTTEQIKKSAVVRIKISAPKQLVAEMISRQSARELVAVMSRYYNIKTDLDMRIIDGPIAKQVIEINVFLWICLSLAFGLVLGFFVTVLTNFIPNKIDETKNNTQVILKRKPLSLTNFSFPMLGMENKKTPPTEVENIFNFNIQKEQEIATIKNSDEAIAILEKKAAAPANLPIAEDDIAFDIEPQLKEETQLIEEIVADAVSKDTTREATPEEVKARLNKLLSGDMLK